MGAALIAALFVMGCSLSGSDDDPEVAKAFDQVLYRSDILRILPKDISPEDSAKLSTTFINNWMKDRAELAQAELNLSDQQKDFDERMENYYNSLVIYAYENELVRQKLNTVVTEEEIQEHFLNNQKEFELRQSIVKVRYLKASDLGSDQQKIVKRSFFSDEEGAMSEVRVICEQQSVLYFDGSEQWHILDNVIQQLNLEFEGRAEDLLVNEKLELSAGDDLFFFHFVDHKLKDDLAPLSMEREKIKDIIIRRRKVELIETMQQDVLDEALRKGNVEVYK